MIHTLAWRNLWRRKQRTLFTALAMGVGVALSIGAMALQAGIFSEVFDEMVTDTLGHIQVHHPQYPTLKHLHDTIPQTDYVVEIMEQVPKTRVVVPRLFTVALAGGKNTSAGALLIGVDPKKEAILSEIDREVIEGRWLKPQAQEEITLGKELAKELDVSIDSQVALVGQDSFGGVAQGLFTVVGLVESGLIELDQGGIWLHLQDAQTLFGLENQVHELLIAGGSTSKEAMSFGKGKQRIKDFKKEIEQVLSEVKQPLLVQTWREARPSISQLMDTQQASAYIMLAIVLAVAAIGVLNTMLMNIYERQREIGVMLALGVKPNMLRKLIFLESFYLASLAALIGLILGGLIAWLLGTYGLDFSVNGEGLSYGGVRLSPRLYGVFEFSAVLLSLSALYIMTFLAAIWPAIKATRVEPVTAISRGDF